ncbi:MAG: hypothetical protein ACYDER_13635 [Ktedonobacteraceae bacterium]
MAGEDCGQIAYRYDRVETVIPLSTAYRRSRAGGKVGILQHWWKHSKEQEWL